MEFDIELWVNDDGARVDMCVIMQEQFKKYWNQC